MTAAPDAPQQPEPLRRWNTYSSERFPPLQHGILIAAFTSGMLSSTARPAPSYQTPTAVSDLVGSATAFLLTLQPRILDKFKNFEEEPPGDRTNRHHGIWVNAYAAPPLVHCGRLGGGWLPSARRLPGSGTAADLGLFRSHGDEFLHRRWPKSYPLVFMLSHSAIVALPGLIRWQKDGDRAGMDGTAGIVMRLAPRELTTFLSA